MNCERGTNCRFVVRIVIFEYLRVRKFSDERSEFLEQMDGVGGYFITMGDICGIVGWSGIIV